MLFVPIPDNFTNNEEAFEIKKKIKNNKKKLADL